MKSNSQELMNGIGNTCSPFKDIAYRLDKRQVHFEIGEMIHILIIILLMYMYVNVSCLTKICGKQS